MIPAVQLIHEPAQVQALAHPQRLEMIEALREPDSAANVARILGRPRQQVNYHLKELARLKLVKSAGERRKGNFIEQLYQSTARRFLVSPRLAWNQDQLAATLRDQIALAQLADLGEQVQRDAAGLIDLAMHDGTEVPSAVVLGDTNFPDQAARAAFMTEFTQSLRALLKKHASKTGTPFRFAFAAYPEIVDGREDWGHETQEND